MSITIRYTDGLVQLADCVNGEVIFLLPEVLRKAFRGNVKLGILLDAALQCPDRVISASFGMSAVAA